MVPSSARGLLLCVGATLLLATTSSLPDLSPGKDTFSVNPTADTGLLLAGLPATDVSPALRGILQGLFSATNRELVRLESETRLLAAQVESMGQRMQDLNETCAAGCAPPPTPSPEVARVLRQLQEQQHAASAHHPEPEPLELGVEPRMIHKRIMQFNQTTEVACEPGADCGEGENVGGAPRLRRRAQTCATVDLIRRMDTVTKECCDEPSEDCSSGVPATCNAGCADIVIAFWDECQTPFAIASGSQAAQLFQGVVSRCQAANAQKPPNTPASFANRFSLICVHDDGIEDCLPQCDQKTHGDVLLATIDGEDTSLTCELHHGRHSWVGSAGTSGYLGSDCRVFVSTINVGAAGFYDLLLDENDVSGITVTLTIQPGTTPRLPCASACDLPRPACKSLILSVPPVPWFQDNLPVFAETLPSPTTEGHGSPSGAAAASSSSSAAT